MVDKKYELVKEDTKSFLGKTLFRIKALKDFSSFKKGELGGYIEKEANLSQEGDAWVSDNASVSDNARVSDNACVSGDAMVSGDARVYGNARVSDNAMVSGDAWVYGDARVYGDAWVSGKVKIDFVLCSQFSFEFDWQIKAWRELEEQFKQRLAKGKGCLKNEFT